jgi:hypothetical protein
LRLRRELPDLAMLAGRTPGAVGLISAQAQHRADMGGPQRASLEDPAPPCHGQAAFFCL